MHVLIRICADDAIKPRSLNAPVISIVLGHPWPGNVRELGTVAARRGVETGAGGPAEGEVSLAEPARPAASPSSAAHELPRWERRRVTVLRTEMLDGESTDDVTPASNLFLASAIEKVQSFGGRVEEVSRNAIEAVFGVEPVDDAARRAALTALAIRMSVTRAQRPAAPGVALRAVIHTSAVLVGHAAGTSRVGREAGP